MTRLSRPVTELPPAAFAAAIAARLGDGPAADALETPTPFTAHQHLARPFARGRVALLGDAAHELSPIGGQGMNLGWLDAIHLDRVLGDALRRGAPPAPFAPYRRRRRAAVRAMRRAVSNTALGAPTRGLPLAVRNALVRALVSPGLRSLARGVVTIRD